MLQPADVVQIPQRRLPQHVHTAPAHPADDQPPVARRSPCDPRARPVARAPCPPAPLPPPIHLPPSPTTPQALCKTSQPIASRRPASRPMPRATSHPAASRGAHQTSRTKRHPEKASLNSLSAPQTPTPPHGMHSPPSTCGNYCRTRGPPKHHPATKRYGAQQPAQLPDRHRQKPRPANQNEGVGNYTHDAEQRCVRPSNGRNSREECSQTSVEKTRACGRGRWNWA